MKLKLKYSANLANSDGSNSNGGDHSIANFPNTDSVNTIPLICPRADIIAIWLERIFTWGFFIEMANSSTRAKIATMS